MPRESEREKKNMFYVSISP